MQTEAPRRGGVPLVAPAVALPRFGARGRPRHWLDSAEQLGSRIPAWALLLPGCFAVVSLLLYGLTVVAWPLPYDQGEGFVLHDAQRVAAGLPLYTGNDVFPFYSSNYPPGFPMLLAWLGRWLGVSLDVGRAVSLAAAVVATVAVAIVVRRHGRGRAALGAAVAAGLFAASPYLSALAPLFKSDVPALALSLVALAIVADRDGRPSAARLALALPLLLAALWIKPLTAAAAGAVLLWAVLARPRLGLSAGAAFGVACLAIAWWIDRRNHGHFLTNFVGGNFSEWRWENLPDLYGRFLLVNLPLVAAGLWYTRRRWADPAARLPLLYFAGCAVIALGVGIWGAGSSYLLHLLAAGAILAGLALGEFPAGAGRGVVALLALAQFVLGFHVAGALPPLVDLRHPTAGTMPVEADRAAAAEIVAWLQEAGAPAYSEDGWFSVAAGMDVVGNPTTLVELEQAGLWRGDGLIAMFEQRAFRTVVIGPHMLPAGVLDAIRRNYTTVDAQTVHGIRYLIARPRP